MNKGEMIYCEFVVYNWSCIGNKYTCLIQSRKFERQKGYQFEIRNCRNVDEVEGIQFLECDMPKIPQNFPWDQFPNLKALEIRNSKLNAVCKNDFDGVRRENLKVFYLYGNNLEYLPGDLLDHMENLEYVSFYGNKIKYVEPELTKSMWNLTYLSFSENININMYYQKDCNTSSMQTVINAIITKCHVPEEVQERINLKQILPEVEVNFENKSKEEVIEEVLKLMKENKQLKDQNCAANDLINALKNEDFKDFTMTVGDQEFKVHKLLLIARSPVLAEMIKNNPEAEHIKLEHIPLDIFQHVLDFLYDDTLPQDDATFKNIFIASGSLKIEKLKNFAGDKLIDQVNADNAFEMLSFANKYDHEELRLKAFKLVKAMFPNLDLEDKIATDQESVNGLYEMKLLQDKFAKKLSGKFKD